MTDEIFMREALRAARNAEGRHAEIHALNTAMNILVADDGNFRVKLFNSTAHLYTA